MTWTKRLLAISVAVSTAVLCAPEATAAPPAATPPAPAWRYTMVGFNTASAQDMDVYESRDGTTFTLLQKAAYRPSSGYVRDPSILAHTDGQYYITYTTADGANIGFARSPDRIHWTQMPSHSLPFCCALLPGTGDGKGPDAPGSLSSLPGFRNGPSLSPLTTKAWAPEWFVDGGTVHVLLSMSTGGGFVPYLMTARNADLTSWSTPVPLDGIIADHIDTTVVKVGDVYHAFTKNETKKIIEHATAPALRGPYTYVTPGPWGKNVEGPAVAELPNGHWRLYFDAYTEGKYLYSDSADGMKTWSTPKELPGLSGTLRHAGILREPA